VLRDPSGLNNTMLVASESPASAGNLRRAGPGLPAPLPLLAVGTAARIEPALTGGDVWTDDRAPVEWLVDLSLLEYANE